jgi:signal peptidase II
LLIIIDFTIKKIVFNYLALNSFIPIIYFLDIAHIQNYGISFGLFSGLIPSWVIILIGSVITAFLIYMMINTSNETEKWGLAVIVAGALSNIVDRGMNNYVLDFIYLHYKDFYWPAFNFADIYITFGVLMILYQVLKELKKKFIK